MKSKQGTKQARFSIRVSLYEKQVIENAAALLETTVSNFLLERGYAAAQMILADQTFFQVPARQWKKLCNLLDAPPRDLPALRKLLHSPDVFKD